jgi:hypothetical protein
MMRTVLKVSDFIPLHVASMKYHSAQLQRLVDADAEKFGKSSALRCDASREPVASERRTRAILWTRSDFFLHKLLVCFRTDMVLCKVTASQTTRYTS